MNAHSFIAENTLKYAYCLPLRLADAGLAAGNSKKALVVGSSLVAASAAKAHKS